MRSAVAAASGCCGAAVVYNLLALLTGLSCHLLDEKLDAATKRMMTICRRGTPT
jgi:hypothetical protein